MINTFNICDFGAVPDGVTDCTAAIQAALDKAGACMGEVIVPPGVYMTGRLTMRTQTKLSGSASWLFGGYGGSIFRLNTGETDCMIDISGAFGCQISGMNLEGCGLGEGIHGVKLYWPAYNGGGREDTPTIDDCKIGHFTGDGVHLEHIWCFSVRHSMLCFNRGAGLYLDGWDGFVLDNWFSGNGNGGITAPVIGSMTCTGNRVEWNTGGGFVFEHCEALNITGNYFDRSGGPGLRLGSNNARMSDSITLTGNLIFRSGKPGPGVVKEADSCHAAFENCVNLTFTGNTMRLGRDDNGKGSYSPNISLVIRDCDYCIFTSNAMHNAAIDEGIRWDGKGHCHFDTNFDDPKPSIRG